MNAFKFGRPTPKSKSVKLHKKNQSYSGIVLADPSRNPQPQYQGAPGEMAKWSNGDTKYQWQFVMSTINEMICDCEEFCQEGVKNAEYGSKEDDGIRHLYVPVSGNLINAMFEALKSAKSLDSDGYPEIEIGGIFTITRTGLDYEKAKKTGGKPPVTFSAEFKRANAATLLKVKEYAASTNDDSDDHSGEMEDLKALLNGTGESLDTEKKDTRLSLDQLKNIT